MDAKRKRLEDYTCPDCEAVLVRKVSNSQKNPNRVWLQCPDCPKDSNFKGWDDEGQPKKRKLVPPSSDSTTVAHSNRDRHLELLEEIREGMTKILAFIAKPQ